MRTGGAAHPIAVQPKLDPVRGLAPVGAAVCLARLTGSPVAAVALCAVALIDGVGAEPLVERWRGLPRLVRLGVGCGVIAAVITVSGCVLWVLWLDRREGGIVTGSRPLFSIGFVARGCSALGLAAGLAAGISGALIAACRAQALQRDPAVGELSGRGPRPAR